MLELSIVAYLIGTFPSAILLAKLLGLSDPRTIGSGNPGATNMVRNGGRVAGGLTFLCDALKGAITVLYAKLQGYPDDLLVWLALWVMVGHMFPVWQRFRGGKGVATCLGGLLVVMPGSCLLALLVWGIIFKLSQHVFLGSLMIPIVFNAGYAFGHSTWSWALVLAVVLIWLRHYRNLRDFFQSMEKSNG